MKKSFDFKVRSAYLILEGITATAVIFDVVIISGKFLSNERAINDAIVLTGRDRLPGIVGGQDLPGKGARHVDHSISQMADSFTVRGPGLHVH